MVKVVHVDAELASYLTAGELSGWADGVQYSPGPDPWEQPVPKRRRKPKAKTRKVLLSVPAPEPKPVSVGQPIVVRKGLP